MNEQPVNLTIRTAKGVCFMWGVFTLVPLLVFLIPDEAGPRSTTIWTGIVLCMLMLMVSLTQVLHKIVVTQTGIEFQDTLAGQLTGKNTALPLANIRTVYIGDWNFTFEKIENFPLKSGPPKARRGQMPRLTIAMTDGKIFGASLVPYAKSDCRKLLFTLQAHGVRCEIQEDLL